MNITNLKKLQSLLGVLVDGIAGAQTYMALAIALSLNPGKYSKVQLIVEIQKALRLSPDGIENDLLIATAIEKLEEKAMQQSDSPDGAFLTLEIPKGNALPTDGLGGSILMMGVTALLGKFQGGLKSKGTFFTGLSSVLGGIAMISKGLAINDTQLASSMIIGGASAVLSGIGLMMARDGTVSDEQAGAKKLSIN